jgi:hypothetical protein
MKSIRITFTLLVRQLGDRTYKVHLDGYNQTDMITGPSQRHEIFYLTETTLAAVRIGDYKYRFTDQPGVSSSCSEGCADPSRVSSNAEGCQLQHGSREMRIHKRNVN